MQIQITNNLKHQAALGVVACKVQVTKSGSELVSLLTNETETIRNLRLKISLNKKPFPIVGLLTPHWAETRTATLLAAKP